MLPDSLECAALRANMEENRLKSRFQHTHKNKSIKAREIMEGKLVIAQDRSRYLHKHVSA